MVKMKTLVVIIPGILFITAAIAQTPQMSTEQENRINRTLDSQYSGLNESSVRWQLDDDGNYIGTFRYNNRDVSATFDREGNWLNSSEKIGMNDLPENFRNDLNKAYGNNRVSSVEKITESDNKVYYGISVIGEERPIYYNQDGTLNYELQNRYNGNNQNKRNPNK